MAKEVIPEIKNNFQFYTDLVTEEKTINDKSIELTKLKKNNKNTLEEITDVIHKNYSNNIKLLVNIKTYNYKFFQFKLRCTDLCGKPFFRYDSDGDTHRNYDENIPLDQQSVPTPHFHHYNDKGVNIAFKTPELKNEATKLALEDIDICINHFNKVANIKTTHGDPVNVNILPGSLQFPAIQEDPNANVNFV